MNVAEIMRALATFAWLGSLAVIALVVLRVGRGRPVKSAAALVLGMIVLATLLTVVSAGLVFVQPEERGVVISALAPKGYREDVLQPGLRWIVPFFENVVIYPISRQIYTMTIAEGSGPSDDLEVTARTSDGQEVFIDGSVIFSIDPDEVIDVHIQWKSRYSTEVVRPQARGIIRDAASQYAVEQIVTSERDAFKDRILLELSDKLADNGLVLVDFVLRNITFSPEYAASVEQKQIAEQQAQQARLVVEQRRQEAEQARQTAQGQADAAVIAAEGRAEARLIEADAEAKALELIAAALRTSPDLITYTYVQKLGPGIQVMLVPNDNPFLLPLPSLPPE